MSEREIAHWVWIGSICALVLARWCWLEFMEFIIERKKYDDHHKSEAATVRPSAERVSNHVLQGQGYRTARTLARLVGKTSRGAQ